MANYEECRSNLHYLNDYYKSNQSSRNEATTRFHLIDRLLLECLGWEHNDIITEQHFNGDYSDYTLSLTRAVAVIEAKKEGIYFELPLGMQHYIYSLKSLCKDDPKICDALKQVSGYCQDRGIQIGIVSNGWQILIFVANRTDSIPPLEGKAFVFDSIDAMLKNFKELWNAISKPGFKGNYILKTLVGDDLPELPSKLSASILNYPGIKDRNPFQTDLLIISDLILEDVIREQDVEKEFLKECYCNSGALSQYALVSKEILQTRYNYLFDQGKQSVNIQSAYQKKGLAKDFSDIIANSLNKRPILLVGDVGVGKSTFIKHLIQVDAEKLFEKAITFVINLGSKATLTSKLHNVVIDELIHQLENLYNINIYDNNFIRGVYNSDLIKFKNGIYKIYFERNDPKAIDKEIEFLEDKVKNKAEYLSKVLLHLTKAHRKQCVIFLDNCDQRDDNTQQQAFLISQEIAEHWNVTTFVTLRPETFHKSIKSGALSGYHPKAFTISPPRIIEVIEKRLDFAQKITRGELPLDHINIVFASENLDVLIEVLKYSLLNNESLKECLENISNGNVRQAIELVKSFLGSGHVNTRKIIDIYTATDRYTIPLHEFLRAIIYGDYVYYSSNNTIFINLFDITYKDKKEHFLLPILLSILSAQMNSRIENGFVESEKLYSQLQSFGYVSNQIDNALIQAYTKKIIESSEKGNIINSNSFPKLFRVTNLGAYHLKILIHQFTYIDAIIIDTPIIDDDFRTKMQDVYDISDRIIRCETFAKYLNECWNVFNSKSVHFNWPECYHAIKENISTVKRKSEVSKNPRGVPSP